MAPSPLFRADIDQPEGMTEDLQRLLQRATLRKTRSHVSFNGEEERGFDISKKDIAALSLYKTTI
jgi:hypothetical protein